MNLVLRVASALVFVVPVASAAAPERKIMEVEVALSEPSEEPPDALDLDSDGDGIPDHIELETGTSPLDADTDGDGIDDGVEDANPDGVVDPGESDPRRPGLSPGARPHIPEPLFFDLVRGLGASKGELEVNVLMGLSRPREGRTMLEWAHVGVGPRGRVGDRRWLRRRV
ncbi:MAG: hypothetical protein EA397_00685 [Deltaproteobacteria bacterium]|nr:MAG: hypothetical protein EA397_00685 [Deltaproteobacteria bacterium]